MLWAPSLERAEHSTASVGASVDPCCHKAEHGAPFS